MPDYCLILLLIIKNTPLPLYWIQREYIEVQKDFKSVLTSCTIIIVLSSICVRKVTWGKTKQIKKQKIESI